MNNEEKALVLGHFIQEGVAGKNRYALVKEFKKEMTRMEEDVSLRRSTKQKLSVSNLTNYLKIYTQPMFRTDAKGGPSQRDNYSEPAVLKLTDVKCIFDDDGLEGAERRTKRIFLEYIFLFYREMSK